MRTPRIIKPSEALDLKHGNTIYVLDMRVTSKQGRDLSDLINESVDATQRFVMAPVPSRLIITQKQFVSLQDYTHQMYETTDRMFLTRSGFILEVQIDRELDVVDEIDEIIEDVEQHFKQVEEELHEQGTKDQH